MDISSVNVPAIALRRDRRYWLPSYGVSRLLDYSGEKSSAAALVAIALLTLQTK
jgi:hypothetical protein